MSGNRKESRYKTVLVFNTLFYYRPGATTLYLCGDFRLFLHFLSSLCTTFNISNIYALIFPSSSSIDDSLMFTGWVFCNWLLDILFGSAKITSKPWFISKLDWLNKSLLIWFETSSLQQIHLNVHLNGLYKKLSPTRSHHNNKPR